MTESRRDATSRFDDRTTRHWTRGALLIQDGLEPTDNEDRTDCRSEYVREPEGTLVEVATESSGVTVDESV